MTVPLIEPEYRLSPPVVEVRVTKRERAHFDIVRALTGAKAGTHVRIHVGRLSPTPWIAEQLPAGMNYQIVASTAPIADEWMRAIGGANG